MTCFKLLKSFNVLCLTYILKILSRKEQFILQVKRGEISSCEGSNVWSPINL